MDSHNTTLLSIYHSKNTRTLKSAVRWHVCAIICLYLTLAPGLNYSIVYKPILEKVSLSANLLLVLTSLSYIKMPLRIGKRHLELAGRWTPSAITFGASAGLALLYFTDWKVVVRYIPFYGGKFKE